MEKRVIIVDFNHMSHSYFHSPHRLSARIKVGDEYVDKDTTIQNGTIKNIFRWTKHGVYPCAVCFDRPVIARKAFFQEHFPDMKVGTAGEYKGNREKMPEAMFEAIQDVERLLRIAHVPVFAEPGYEADDLIFACVQRAKEKYPGMPIDIITNDADLLPLVDETVSVFLRSKKGTYAERADLEKAKYVQVTPRNFQEVVEDLSDYRGFIIPYNTILLYKLLRGDNSDNYKRKDISRLFSPKRYNNLMISLLADNINLGQIFRYSVPETKILYKGTDEPFNGTLKEALASPDKNKLYKKICNSEELDLILYILKNYTEMTDEMVDHVEKMYWGVNLNQAYPNANPALARRSYVVGKSRKGIDIDQYKEIDLIQAVRDLQIRLM